MRFLALWNTGNGGTMRRWGHEDVGPRGVGHEERGHEGGAMRRWATRRWGHEGWGHEEVGPCWRKLVIAAVLASFKST